MKDWAALPIRLGLGMVFIAHGLQKAFGLFDGSGITGFAEMLKGLGFPLPGMLAYAVAYIEFIGGIFLVLGLFTRGTAFVLALVMLVAMAKVHLENGFFLSAGGYEYTLVIVCSLLSLLSWGGGNLSFDKK